MSVTTHMANGFKDYSHPTYDEIQLACRHIAEFIHYNDSGIGKVDNIVGITRGGLMPAQELSHILNIPMKTVTYSSKLGNGDNKNHDNGIPAISNSSILLVDDIVDSGRTMKELVDIFTDQGNKVFTASVYFKDRKEQTIISPDVWAIKISQNFGWILYPWETNSK